MDSKEVLDVNDQLAPIDCAELRKMLRGFQFKLDGRTMKPCFEVLCPLIEFEAVRAQQHTSTPRLKVAVGASDHGESDDPFSLADAMSDEDDDIITSSDPDADTDIASMIMLPNPAGLTSSLPSQLQETYTRMMVPLLIK